MAFQPTRGRFGWRSLATLALFGLVFLPLSGSRGAATGDKEVEIAAIGLDDAALSATRIETDTETKIEGKASTRITTRWPTTVCLAEVENPEIEGGRLLYSAQVKSDLDQAASLEMWAHVDGGVYFSRNPNVAVFGKSDWKRLAIPFFFKEGQRPDKVTLNLIIGGPGTVWVDDIRLTKQPLSGVGAAAPKSGLSPVRKNVAADGPASKDRPQSSYPVVIESVPEIGATDVDPHLDEIRVTFDRDMDTSGFSWTGNSKSEEFPPINEDRGTRWIDKRTCLVAVNLARGKFYRIGINATDFQNFKSADGKPAEHAAIYFATEGAKRSVARRTIAPEVVELSPKNGDDDVDPSTKTISVTFNTKMGGDYSWIRAGENYPGSGSGRPTWSKDGKTCTLSVELAPGTDYAVGLNGSHYINYQSRYGVPLSPVVWSFSTAEE